MLYKAFLVVTIISCSAALGIMCEKRVLKQRMQLKNILAEMVKLCSAMEEQGMILSEAMEYCGKKGNDLFINCTDIMKRHPEMPSSKIIKMAMEKSQDIKEFDKSDKDRITEFMLRVFGAVTFSEIKSECSVFTKDMNERLRELGNDVLKRAKIKRTMFILGGIALSIILL